MKMRNGIVIGIVLVAVQAASVLGQDEPSVASVLQDFERNAEELGPPDRSDVSITIMFHDRYPPSRVDSILDGLQRLASTASAGSTRRLATVWLLIAGQRSDARGLAGVVARLSEVYENSPSTHRLILLGMPQQAETEAAISFLSNVLIEGSGTEARMALQGLRSIGPQGGGSPPGASRERCCKRRWGEGCS